MGLVQHAARLLVGDNLGEINNVIINEKGATFVRSPGNYSANNGSI